MENFGPAILAFVLNCSGVYVFRTPKDIGCFPSEAYVIILIFVLILQWNTKFYPSSYRRLFPWAQFLFEFIVGMFVMEFVMDDIWLPILGAFVGAVTKLVDITNDKIDNYGIRINALTSLLDAVKTTGGLKVITIAFSTFVLFWVLQVTDTVDFHIIGCCGGKAFAKDTLKRGKRFARKFLHVVRHRCRSRHISFAPGTKKPSDFDEDDTLLDDNLVFNQNYRYCRSPRDYRTPEC